MADGAMTSGGSNQLIGQNWVQRALQNMLGQTVDLRDGGAYLPENLPPERLQPILDRITSIFHKEIDPQTGKTRYTLVRWPVIFGESTDTGQLQGSLAEFCEYARGVLRQQIGKLKDLKPLPCNPCPEQVETRRAIVANELAALLRGFSRDPLQDNVDGLFEALLGDDDQVVSDFQELVSAASCNTLINTAEAEREQIKYDLVRESLQSLKVNWDAQKGKLLKSIGFRAMHLSWKIQAIQDTITKLEAALEDECVSGATRWTVPVTLGGGEETNLAAFLNHIREESARWLELMRTGGEEGIKAMKPFVEAICTALRKLLPDRQKDPKAENLLMGILRRESEEERNNVRDLAVRLREQVCELYREIGDHGGAYAERTALK